MVLMAVLCPNDWPMPKVFGTFSPLFALSFQQPLLGRTQFKGTRYGNESVSTKRLWRSNCTGAGYLRTGVDFRVERVERDQGSVGAGGDLAAAHRVYRVADRRSAQRRVAGIKTAPHSRR